MRNATCVLLALSLGCGGPPFELFYVEPDASDVGEIRETHAPASPVDDASSPVADASAPAPIEETGRGEAAVAMLDSSDASTDPPDAWVCSPVPTGPSLCVNASRAPGVFNILYASGGCGVQETPTACQSCAELYTCSCVLAGDPGMCGGTPPLACGLRQGILVVTCS